MKSWIELSFAQFLKRARDKNDVVYYAARDRAYRKVNNKNRVRIYVMDSNIRNNYLAPIVTPDGLGLKIQNE